jgi:hypothetical protein
MSYVCLWIRLGRDNKSNRKWKRPRKMKEYGATETSQKTRCMGDLKEQ